MTTTKRTSHVVPMKQSSLFRNIEQIISYVLLVVSVYSTIDSMHADTIIKCINTHLHLCIT